MNWYVIFLIIAVGALFASGWLSRSEKYKGAVGALLGIGLAILYIVGTEAIREARFDGHTSTTPEPAVYNVIFIHELSEDEILVGVHLDDSSYKRVFQLKREWSLDKNIPPAPEHLIVSEGDEEQLVIVLR